MEKKLDKENLSVIHKFEQCINFSIEDIFVNFYYRYYSTR